MHLHRDYHLRLLKIIIQAVHFLLYHLVKNFIAMHQMY
nr:MAG TPA: hypothetical protein [Caudoviricetes sp.]